MKEINLPIYGIKVTIDVDGSGTITSDLHTNQSEDELYNSAMDGVESLILSCACAGIDIETPEFLEAIETSVEACSNNI
jgi:hypothetical protein